MRGSSLLVVLASAAAAVGCEAGATQSLDQGGLRLNGTLGSITADCVSGFTLREQKPAGTGADRNGDGLVCIKIARSGAIVALDNSANGSAHSKHAKHGKHHKP